MPGKVIAITGIDTGVGKTAATGLLARTLRERGRNVITQKPVETGGEGVSSDIFRHREIMGIDLCEADLDGTTCSYLFRYPASPHLSAAMEKQVIDVSVIDDATRRLQARYDIVLLEGAGGLLVPLNEALLFADFLQERSYPLILVTSSRLGSINHTLLSIEACRKRGLRLCGLIYNHAGGSDGVIASDTLEVLRSFLEKYGYSCPVVELPDMEMSGWKLMNTDLLKVFDES
ncbi:dethiobiotin synthase [Prosthecochloris sp.]|uniref:dethiobiotin synthase n=1 Tax=Prosthecochloris sp. TaxID=290513 RepID=UPI00257AA088|nr:dethiobiotin synthase [Prosthecochloris sp.]